MLKTVTNQSIDYKITVDENATESDMRRAATHFFSGKRKRETFDVYRGCLICGFTVDILRKMTVYLFGTSEEGNKVFRCVAGSDNNMMCSKGLARELIDSILDSGEYT